MSQTQSEDDIEIMARAAHAARRAAIEAKPFDANLGTLVERFCQADLEATAWVFFDSGEVLKRRDILDRVTRLASSLNRIGIMQGTHVAVMLPNISAFPVTWLALARLGAVMVPVNVRYTPAELGYVLTDSEAEFLVIDRSLITTFNALETRPGSVDRRSYRRARRRGARQSQLGTACRRGNGGICSSLVGRAKTI